MPGFKYNASDITQDPAVMDLQARMPKTGRQPMAIRPLGLAPARPVGGMGSAIRPLGLAPAGVAPGSNRIPASSGVGSIVPRADMPGMGNPYSVTGPMLPKIGLPEIPDIRGAARGISVGGQARGISVGGQARGISVGGSGGELSGEGAAIRQGARYLLGLDSERAPQMPMPPQPMPKPLGGVDPAAIAAKMMTDETASMASLRGDISQNPIVSTPDRDAAIANQAAQVADMRAIQGRMAMSGNSELGFNGQQMGSRVDEGMAARMRGFGDLASTAELNNAGIMGNVRGRQYNTGKMVDDSRFGEPSVGRYSHEEMARRAGVAERVAANAARQLSANESKIREMGREPGQDFIGPRRKNDEGQMVPMSNYAAARAGMTPEQLAANDMAGSAGRQRMEDSAGFRAQRAQLRRGFVTDSEGNLDIPTMLAIQEANRPVAQDPMFPIMTEEGARAYSVYHGNKNSQNAMEIQARQAALGERNANSRELRDQQLLDFQMGRGPQKPPTPLELLELEDAKLDLEAKKKELDPSSTPEGRLGMAQGFDSKYAKERETVTSDIDTIVSRWPSMSEEERDAAIQQLSPNRQALAEMEYESQENPNWFAYMSPDQEQAASTRASILYEMRKRIDPSAEPLPGRSAKPFFGGGSFGAPVRN